MAPRLTKDMLSKRLEDEKRDHAETKKSLERLKHLKESHKQMSDERLTEIKELKGQLTTKQMILEGYGSDAVKANNKVQQASMDMRTLKAALNILTRNI